MKHTDTHLLRIVIAKCELECIIQAKHSPVTCQDGIGSAKIFILILTEAEAEVLGKRSHRKLKSSKNPQIRHAGSWLSPSRYACADCKKMIVFFPVLGLAGGHCRENETAEVGLKKSGYAGLIRLCILYNQVASLDMVPDCLTHPPA